MRARAWPQVAGCMPEVPTKGRSMRALGHCALPLLLRAHCCAPPLPAQLALNAFADLTWEEFKSTRLGFKGEAAKELRAKK